MKKSVYIIICFFITQNLFSQFDPKAKEVLDKVTAKMKSLAAYNIKYTLEHENSQEGTKTSDNGEIMIKGDKYRVLMDQSEIYCNGKEMWTYMKQNNEVTVFKGEDNSGSGSLSITNPKNFLEFYDKDYKYDYIEEISTNGILLDKIDIYPKNLKAKYTRIRLLIDKTKNQIYSVKVFYKNGNNFIFSVKEFKAFTEANDILFNFDKTKHPGVEIIDMR